MSLAGTNRFKFVLLAGAIAVLGIVAWLLNSQTKWLVWTDEEIRVLGSLSISNLGPPPLSRSNAVADEPRAAKMGQQLFFDTQLSANGKIACASCHQPERRFTDGLPKGQGLGTSRRNTLSIVGSAYSPWLYWDGRRDSLWSQALTPLEDQHEHGTNRVQVTRAVLTSSVYRKDYEALFGLLPDPGLIPDDVSPTDNSQWRNTWNRMSLSERKLINRIFSNIGKTIAAYIRLINPEASRFDSYVQAVLDADETTQRATFDADEIHGLRLFIGKANCIQCHNGALFTNHEFHNTGVISFPGEVPDKGRIEGIRQVIANPFNCLGTYSDDPERECPELRFPRTGIELIGAFRTPSLRNLEGTAPYMHKGQIPTLTDVLVHYNRAPPAMLGHNEIMPLKLSRKELRQLERFLHTLAAPVTMPTE